MVGAVSKGVERDAMGILELQKLLMLDIRARAKDCSSDPKHREKKHHLLCLASHRELDDIHDASYMKQLLWS